MWFSSAMNVNAVYDWFVQENQEVAVEVMEASLKKEDGTWKEMDENLLDFLRSQFNCPLLLERSSPPEKVRISINNVESLLSEIKEREGGSCSCIPVLHHVISTGATKLPAFAISLIKSKQLPWLQLVEEEEKKRRRK